MILRARTWKGGSTYEVTVSPEQLVDRLPLPGEDVVLADMGRVRVMGARDVSRRGLVTAFLAPDERLYSLVVQTADIGPGFPDL